MSGNFEFIREGLTGKSIMYWAKTCNPEEYNKVHKDTIDYYITQFQKQYRMDLAMVLYTCINHTMFAQISKINRV